MTAKKKMNKSERKIRSDVKKDMQKKGLVPPDKPRLNRKKYIEEAREECGILWVGYMVERSHLLYALAYGSAPACFF